MAQGNYDHPSYLTRQQIALPKTTAGAGGTSFGVSLGNSSMRLRAASGVVITAGTVGTGNAASNSIILAQGTGILQYTSTGVTTSTGVVTLGTCNYGTGGNTIWVTSTSADMNATIPAGGQVFVKGGTDATMVAQVTLETYLDPQATWTGVNN